MANYIKNQVSRVCSDADWFEFYMCLLQISNYIFESCTVKSAFINCSNVMIKINVGAKLTPAQTCMALNLLYPCKKYRVEIPIVLNSKEAL